MLNDTPRVLEAAPPMRCGSTEQLLGADRGVWGRPQQNGQAMGDHASTFSLTFDSPLFVLWMPILRDGLHRHRFCYFSTLSRSPEAMLVGRVQCCAVAIMAMIVTARREIFDNVVRAKQLT